MQRFRKIGPKITDVFSGTQVGAWITLYRAVKVGTLMGVKNEEDRRGVADNVSVTLFGVEAHCETTNVSFSIGGSSFTGDGGETDEDIRFFPYFAKDIRLRVFGDVVSNFECTESSRAFCVHAAFWNNFAIEVR